MELSFKQILLLRLLEEDALEKKEIVKVLQLKMPDIKVSTINNTLSSLEKLRLIKVLRPSKAAKLNGKKISYKSTAKGLKALNSFREVVKKSVVKKHPQKLQLAIMACVGELIKGPIYNELNLSRGEEHFSKQFLACCLRNNLRILKLSKEELEKLFNDSKSEYMDQEKLENIIYGGFRVVFEDFLQSGCGVKWKGHLIAQKASLYVAEKCNQLPVDSVKPPKCDKYD